MNFFEKIVFQITWTLVSNNEKVFTIFSEMNHIHSSYLAIAVCLDNNIYIKTVTPSPYFYAENKNIHFLTFYIYIYVLENIKTFSENVLFFKFK